MFQALRNADWDSWKWYGVVLHHFVTGLGVTWLTIDRLWERFKPVEEFVEKRYHERRHNHMNVFDVPKFIQDAVKLANDLKAAEAVLAPQFPQLVADANQLKTDGEAILGVSNPPPAVAQ